MFTNTLRAITSKRQIGLFTFVAAICVSSVATAEIQTFTDLASWQAAVGGITHLEDFEGQVSDDFFGTASNSTRSPNGILGLSANANFSDNAIIDVDDVGDGSGYVSSGAVINGNAVVSLRFLDKGTGANSQETVTVSLPPGVEAFAFEYKNYDNDDDGTFLSFEGTNGGIVTAFDSSNNFTGFFGVLDTDPGAEITSFSFTGDPNVGAGFSAFNSFDDVRYSDFDALKLQVNSVTGQVELFNESGTDFEFDWYRLSSSTSDLNFAGWNSLSDQEIDAIDGLDPDSTVGNGIGETWDEAGGSSDDVLSEAFLLSTSIFGQNRTVDLGTAFKPGGDTDSLTFEYRRPDGEIREALIEVVTTAGVPGDYNNDGEVDAADYTVWRDNLNQNVTLPNENPAASTPGVVDQEDYNFWVSNYGISSATASATAVPEPSTSGLISCMLVSLLGIKRDARRN